MNKTYFLNSSGSWSFSRNQKRIIGGITPNPRDILHAARKCFSVQMTTNRYGTKAPITKPQSIMTLVNRMNHLFLVPLFNSPVASLQATEPAGYSPPIPIPTRKRYAVSAANIPCRLPWYPYEPAPRAAKTMRIIVETRREFLRDLPKISMSAFPFQTLRRVECPSSL